MTAHLFEVLRGYFAHYGYWTVAFALLLENAGLPVPGETVLLFASFLAYSQKELHMPIIILTGTIAAAVGDNIGYVIGHRGGRPLLDRWKHFFHISQRNVNRGERLFQRYGAVAVFFARFIFGMRVIAGPMAGVLRMPWRRFALFNLLGAVTWVTVISLAGYFFGRNWDLLVKAFKEADIAALGIVLLLLLWFWIRRRRRLSGERTNSED